MAGARSQRAQALRVELGEFGVDVHRDDAEEPMFVGQDGQAPSLFGLLRQTDSADGALVGAVQVPTQRS